MKPRSSKKQRVTRQADATTPTLESAESIARRHRAEARQKARDALFSEIVVNENDGPIVTPQQPSGTLPTTSQRGYSGLPSANKSILANLQISNTIRLKVVTHCLTPTSSSLSDGKKTPFPVLVHNLVSETKDPTMIRWVSDGGAFVVNRSHPDLIIALGTYFSYSKYSTFRNRLNKYGWKKSLTGPYAGAYVNPSFHRDKPFDEIAKISKNSPSPAAVSTNLTPSGSDSQENPLNWGKKALLAKKQNDGVKTRSARHTLSDLSNSRPHDQHYLQPPVDHSLNNSLSVKSSTPSHFNEKPLFAISQNIVSGGRPLSKAVAENPFDAFPLMDDFDKLFEGLYLPLAAQNTPYSQAPLGWNRPFISDHPSAMASAENVEGNGVKVFFYGKSAPLSPINSTFETPKHQFDWKDETPVTQNPRRLDCKENESSRSIAISEEESPELLSPSKLCAIYGVSPSCFEPIPIFSAKGSEEEDDDSWSNGLDLSDFLEECTWVAKV